MEPGGHYECGFRHILGLRSASVNWPVLLVKASLCVQCRVRPNKWKHLSLEQRKVCSGPCEKNAGITPLQKPQTPPKLSAQLFQKQAVRLVVANFLVQEFSVPECQVTMFLETSCKKCNFLVWKFYVHEWKSVILLKIRALGMGWPVYFRL